MRLNRSTIILIIGALVIIGAVLVINNRQAEAPADPTPTVSAGAGPVFDELAGDDVARLEIINNTNGDSVVLVQSASSDWHIAQATYSTSRATDQEWAVRAIGDFVLLQANDRFDNETFAAFGLATPGYILLADTIDGTRYTLYVGNRNPTGNRYYVTLETGETPAELRPELEALAAARAAAEDGDVEISEATEEAEAVDDSEVIEVTEEADADDAEATDEPEADEAETTPEPYPSLTLSAETGRVYVVPQLTISDLVGLVAAPPYVAAPTATPTATATLNPLSEVEQATATAEFNATATALFEALETEIALTATAAAEVTPEAEATEEASE